jgi:hypothetical protein
VRRDGRVRLDYKIVQLSPRFPRALKDSIPGNQELRAAMVADASRTWSAAVEADNIPQLLHWAFQFSLDDLPMSGEITVRVALAA